MKNTHITLIVLIVLAAGALFFFGMGEKAEAPTLEENKEASGAVSQGMPIINAPGTPEKFVVETPVLKEFVVSGQNFSFEPSLIAVQKGDKVKITFKNTSGFHDFKIDEFGVAAQQSKFPYQEVLEFTADKVGSFEYYCSVGTHRAMGMKGILKVE